MANNDDERIETYVNRNGIQGDTDFFLEKLRELDEAFARVNNIKLDLNKSDSFRMVIDNAGKLSQATKTLATNVDNYRAIQDQATKAILDASAASAGQGDVALKQANALAALKLAQQQNAALQKEYKKQLDNGTLSLEQYQEKLGAVILKQAEYKTSIAALNKDLNASVTATIPAAPVPQTFTPPKSVSVIAPNSVKESQKEVIELQQAQSAAITTAQQWAASQKEAVNQVAAAQPEIERTGEVVNDLDRKQVAAIADANEWARSQVLAGAASEAAAADQVEALTELERTALILKQQKGALADIELEQQRLKIALSDGLISQDEYNKKIAQSIIIENELKVSVAALNKELSLAAKAGLAVPGSIRQAQAENLIFTNERSNIAAKEGFATPEDLARIQELNALIDANNKLIDENSDKLARQKINIGNYPQEFKVAFGTLDAELQKTNNLLLQPGLSGKQLEDLTAKQQALRNATVLVTKEFSSTAAQTNAFKESARQIGQTFGTDSEIFKTYSAQVAQGAAQTRKIGEEVENAGKKSNILVSGLSNIWSSLRQIAYAIPGLGIAGLIGLLLDPLTAFASSLVRTNVETEGFKNAVDELKFSIKEMDDALEGTGKTTASAAENVDNLKESVRLAKEGVISKTEAVKLYNDTMGKTTGAVNTLDEVEQKLIKNADAYIKFTLLKAAAQVAAGKAAEQAFQAALDAQKSAESFSTLGTNINSANAVAGGLSSAEVDQLRAKELEENRKKAIKAAEDQKNALLKIEQQFNDQAAAIAKQFNFNFNAQSVQQQEADRVNAIDLEIQALTRYQNKQDEIAKTDTNTYDKRRQALVNYNNTLQQLIRLNTQKDLLGAVGDHDAQALILSKQKTALEKAASDSYDRLHALDESYRVRKLTADEQLAEDELNQVIKSNEAIYKDDQKSLEDRLAAYKAYIEAQAQLLDYQRNEKLSAAGFSDQEIANFKAGLEVQLQGKKITSEELLAIEGDYQSKLAALTASSAKNVYDITISWAKKTQQDIDLINKQHDDTDLSIKYLADITALNGSYQKRLIAAKDYFQKLEDLNRDYGIAQLQRQVDNDEKALQEEYKHGNDLQAAIQQSIQDLITARETGTQGEIDENQARLDGLLKDEKDYTAAVVAIRKKLAADVIAILKKQGAAEEKEHDESLKKLQKAIEQSAHYAQRALSIVDEAFSGRYDAERQQIQNTIDAIQAKAQADIDSVNATTLNADDKAKEIAKINARAAAQEQQQREREKQLDYQKAKFEKEKAIFDIGINTAVEISKHLGEPWMIAAIAALGAAEIAVVASQSLPQYKYGAGVNGRPKHPGGPAEVGHGKPELVITPAGEAFVTPSIPTRMNLPRDTTVLPDARAAVDNIINHSLLNFDRYATPEPDGQLLQANHQLRNELKVLQQIVANKRETHINGSWAGLEVMFRQGYSWMKYVDGNTNFMRRNK